MDELEFLKKDWKKQEASYPRLSYDQIYNMIWKRSSSIVKWIFVISILEFLFWSVLNIFLANDEYWDEMERLNLKEISIVSYVVGTLITFFFIWQFYINYKRISSTDNAATLMKKILRTRKTVKYYIGYVLISTSITSLVYMYFFIDYHSNNTIVDDPQKYEFSTTQWAMFLGLSFLFLLVFLGLIWLLYRMIYGIFLKKLNRNYTELKKLEV